VLLDAVWRCNDVKSELTQTGGYCAVATTSSGGGCIKRISNLLIAGVADAPLVAEGRRSHWRIGTREEPALAFVGGPCEVLGLLVTVVDDICHVS
jgi:hypothetical protein